MDVARDLAPFFENTSVSEMMPTTWPSPVTTGAPVIRLDASVIAISSSGVSSWNVITFRVITSFTGIISVGAV